MVSRYSFDGTTQFLRKLKPDCISSGKIQRSRRQTSQGLPPCWTTWHWQDSSRSGCRWSSRSSLLPRFRFRVRRSPGGPRCPAGPGPFPSCQGSRPLRHLHRRDRLGRVEENQLGVAPVRQPDHQSGQCLRQHCNV